MGRESFKSCVSALKARIRSERGCRSKKDISPINSPSCIRPTSISRPRSSTNNEASPLMTKNSASPTSPMSAITWFFFSSTNSVKSRRVSTSFTVRASHRYCWLRNWVSLALFSVMDSHSAEEPKWWAVISYFPDKLYSICYTFNTFKYCAELMSCIG